MRSPSPLALGIGTNSAVFPPFNGDVILGLSGHPMPTLRRARALLLLLSIPALLTTPAWTAAAQQDGAELPDAAGLLRDVRERALRDYDLQDRFTYIEERRDVRVSKLGKVEVGPLRTFQVFPSSGPGRTYKRLIAVDGKPLDPDELARRDREHERHLAEQAERERNETPERRAERLRRAHEAIEERNAILDDALAVFEPEIEDRETIDGQPVFRLTLTPRDDARVHTREGRWMKEMAGRVWIAEADRQIVKVDLEAQDDLTIGWGLLGRIHEGSRFVFSRRYFEGVWLPAEIVFDATGCTLLFRKFDLDVVTTYSNYSRLP